MSGTGLHLHLDPQGGVAGDMFTAALLDARPDLTARVMADITAVLPPEAGRAALERVVRTGISSGHFRLVPGTAPARKGAETTWQAMDLLLESAATAPGTARHARAILRRLAEAESAIHGIPLERVHFHEIADWDALMDVTAAGSLLAALDGATFSLSPLPLGGGQVRTAHGLLAVPAPATQKLLEGYLWHDDGISGERVTPTGAAIIAHLTQGQHPQVRPGGRLIATGYGAGSREMKGVPNVLRVTVFAGAAVGLDEDRVAVLICDVDDMTGEEIATAADQLRALPGVVDLALLTLQGKKGRPATRFELLVTPEDEDAALHALFVQTSTLGVRRLPVCRAVLPRAQGASADGLPGKWARRPDGTVTGKIEADALKSLPTLAGRRRAAYWMPDND